MSESYWTESTSKFDVQDALERIREACRSMPKVKPVQRILMLRSLYQKLKEQVQRFEPTGQSIFTNVCQEIYGIPCEQFDNWDDLMNRKILLQAVGVNAMVLADEIKEEE
jgi:hypothetical protein